MRSRVTAFRSTQLARILASPACIVLCMTVSLCSGVLSIARVDCEASLAVNMELTAVCVLVIAINTKPHWSPTLRYPGGWIVGPVAVLLVSLYWLGMVVMGGSPIRTVNAGIHYYATDHGVDTPLSAGAFWFLIVFQAASWSAVLLHFLLENRWRYKCAKEFQSSRPELLEQP